MKRFNRTLLAAAAVSGLVAGSGFAQTGLSNTRPGVQQFDEPKWKHPHMHHALAALQNARTELTETEDVFKGHRDEAIGHVDRAIDQIHKGLIEQGDDEASLPGNRPSQLDDQRFPHMYRALESLREARTELDAAGKIFGGHRDEAIQHTDMAIHQLEDAMR